MDAILKLHEQISAHQARRQPREPRSSELEALALDRQADRADEGPAAVSESLATERSAADEDAVRRRSTRSRRPSRSGTACSAPHGTGDTVGLRRPGPHRSSCPAPARARTAATFDETADALERVLAEATTTATRSRRSSSTATSSPSTCAARHLVDVHAGHCATTRRCASRCAWASAASTTRDETGPRAARRLPPAVGHAQPPGPRRGRLRPTPTRTSRRSCSVYPGNDWHERETCDFFGIIFDGHPGADPDRDARRLAGSPAAQGLPAGRHPGRVQGRRRSRRRTSGGRTADDRLRQHVPTAADDDAYAASRETTEGTVYTVTGQDWDDTHGRPRRRRRGAHRRQHGAAAPVDARRAPADPRARRRDGHRVPARHRLPAHRHREELRVPHLDPGRHVRDAHGLPRAAVQRVRLRPRRRAAARHRGRDPASGPTSSG